MAESNNPRTNVGVAAAPTRTEPLDVEVHVKFLRRERLSLLCSPLTLVAELKRRVLALHTSDDDAGSLRLIYKGKVLKDEQSLDASDFTSGDTLHGVFGRPQAPSSAPAPAETAAPAASGFSVNGNAENVNTVTTAAVGELRTSVFSSIGSAVSDGHVAAGAGAQSEASPSFTSTTTPVATPMSAPTTTTAQTAPSTPRMPSADMLLTQAASLRRTIPALELAPLSQPPALSDDMYALGNALREAADTFLAVHRQLQFVATRFLSEHNLSASERLRLHTRVHQLEPILDQVTSLSQAVAINLASSSYGSRSGQTPVVSGSPSPQDTGRSTSGAAPVFNAPPATTPGISVSPTVNVFATGGSGSAQIGSSIADLLQMMNSAFRPPGASGSNVPSSTPAPPNLPGSILNLVSALAGAASGGQSATAGPPQEPARAEASPLATSTSSGVSGGPVSVLFAHVRVFLWFHSFNGSASCSPTTDAWNPHS